MREGRRRDRRRAHIWHRNGRSHGNGRRLVGRNLCSRVSAFCEWCGRLWERCLVHALQLILAYAQMDASHVSALDGGARYVEVMPEQPSLVHKEEVVFLL